MRRGYEIRDGGSVTLDQTRSHKKVNEIDRDEDHADAAGKPRASPWGTSWPIMRVRQGKRRPTAVRWACDGQQPVGPAACRSRNEAQGIALGHELTNRACAPRQTAPHRGAAGLPRPARASRPCLPHRKQARVRLSEGSPPGPAGAW